MRTELVPSGTPLLADLDRLTRWAAVGISRRTVLRGVVGAAAAWAAGGWLEPLVATADNCNNSCNGLCSSCFSYWDGCCYSPNNSHAICGNYCTCSDCSNGGCGCFYAWINVCDSGAYSYGCSMWCWC